jgi:hypothetical protein
VVAAYVAVGEDNLIVDRAKAAAVNLIDFLETGVAAEGLFATDAFCDFTMPLWRIQAEGGDNVVALRLRGHPGRSTVVRSRFDETATGFVLEVEERWNAAGKDWYCREMMRVDLDGASIRQISVYCTGDWDTARQAQHAAAVKLPRP